MKKKILKTLRTISLRNKIRFFIMSIIIVIFALFLGVISYIYTDIFEKNIKQNMKNDFSQMYYMLDSIMQNAKKVSETVENNERIREFISSEQDFVEGDNDSVFEYYAEYFYTRHEVDRLKDIYDLSEIDLYTNSGHLYMKEQRKEFPWEKMVNATWYEYLLSEKELSMFCGLDFFAQEEITSENDLQYIKLVKSSRDYSKNIGAIRVQIDQNRLQDIMCKTVTMSGTTMLQNEKGEILVSFGDIVADIGMPYKDVQTIERQGDNFVIRQRLQDTNLYLVNVISYAATRVEFNHLKILLGIAAVILLLSTFWLVKRFTDNITSRLHDLMGSMKLVKEGTFQAITGEIYMDDVGLCISDYNSMLADFQDLLSREKEHEKHKRELQLQVLQEQINPHFLYNTLEMINNVAIINDFPEISDIIIDLSSYYRIALSSGKETHSIRDELEHIRLYSLLQNRRFQKNIILKTFVDEGCEDVSILKLILQPIIENSYCHGFSTRLQNREFEIQVRVKREGEYMIIVVSDNGIGMPSYLQESILNDKSKSFGVRSTNERIQLFYGDESGIKISSVPGKGTDVTLKLKLIDKEDVVVLC